MKPAILMSCKRFLSNFLNRHDLVEPDDGRPLYRYEVTAQDYEDLQSIIRQRAHRLRDIEDIVHARELTACIVLWGSVWYRKERQAGQKYSDMVESIACQTCCDDPMRRELIENGLKWWGIEIRTAENGRHHFVHTLAAQGGLPEYMMADKGKPLQTALISLIKKIEEHPISPG